jgi:hypothetical protein
MTVSFGDQATEDLYHNRPTRRARRFPPEIVGSALVKLDMLEAVGGASCFAGTGTMPAMSD